jgi:membrane-bound metal-dependent hydrolase YbcI (DUF457 family)
MPSPIGHALGGIAAGAAIGGVRAPAGRLARGRIVAFAAAGMAADLDLLFGTHSTYSHSVGAVAIVGLLAAASTASARPSDTTRPWRLATAMAAACASHLLLDWVNTDYASPIGIMALWPFSTAHFHAGVAIFPPVSREFGAAWFLSTNAWAAAVELTLLGPIALAAVVAARPRPAGLRTSRRDPSGAPRASVGQRDDP